MLLSDLTITGVSASFLEVLQTRYNIFDVLWNVHEMT